MTYTSPRAPLYRRGVTLPRRIEISPGQRFGRFSVVRDLPPEGTTRMIECRCDCGELRAVALCSLRTGVSQSCGCLRRELLSSHPVHPINDLTGVKFGHLTGVERVGHRWLFRCDCGNLCLRFPANIKTGHRSCGCQRKPPRDAVAKKECTRQWRIENPEKKRAQQKRWLSIPENKRRIAELQRGYRAANPEKYRLWGRNKKPPTPESQAVRNARRRALKAGAEGSHTKADILNLMAQQGGKCAACAQPFPAVGKKRFSVDHIMPLARGGSEWPSNLQLLCCSCNSQKGALHPDDWLAKQARKAAA